MATDRYTVIVDTKGAEGNLKRLGTSVGNLKGLLAGAFVVGGITAFAKEILNVSKQYEVMANQLKLVTAGQDDLTQTFAALQDVSNRTYTTLQDTVQLYGNLKLSTEALGKTSTEVIAVTEKFQKALALSGADANTAAGAIRQFGQAMASGQVRGDEFNSIVEALGPALAIMARESGTTVGELREMSREGELTADVFFEMIKGAEGLDAAFSSLDLTTEQIGVNLRGTFTETLQIINEATGASERYQNILISLNQNLANLFGTSQSLASLTAEDLFGEVEAGALNAQVAIVELKNRYLDLYSFSDAFGLISMKERAAIKEQIAAIQELTESRRAEHEEAQKQLEADRELERKRAEMLRPLTDMGVQLDAITKAYEKNIPQNQKLQTEYESVTETLNKLLAMRDEEIAQTPEYEQALKVTQERLAQLKGELDGTAKSADAASRSMKRLVEGTAKTIEGFKDKTQEMQFEFDKLNMNALEREIADIERDIETRVKKQIQELEAAMTPENAAQITAQINALKDAASEAIQQQSRLATESYEYQRTFSHGWSQAFQQYAEEATNAATTAETLFKQATTGIEDAIVQFVKTGKLSFKSLLEDLAETVVRSGVRNIMADIGGLITAGPMQGPQRPSSGGIGGFIKGALGSALGGFFGGLFANGGYLPQGKFGIVGERGPEMIQGPASITPGARSGGMNVTINAVDAASFKQMVARDPEFIYAVAQRGSRSFR